MSELDETGMRRLLVYLAAAAVAGGQPVHEVESDVRRLATRLGRPGIQVDASPTGVVLSLGGGTPATFEAVEGTLRLDQSVDTYEIRSGLEHGTLAPEQALERLKALRRIPHRYPKAGLELGMLCVATGIALILQPTWPSVAFAAVAGQVTAAFIRLSGRWRSVATLTPFLAAFIIAFAAFGAAQLGLITNPIRSLLPPIAVLLPGALIVTGMAELAAGAMTAGTSRLVFGAGQLLLFALGVAGAAWLLDVPSYVLINELVNESILEASADCIMILGCDGEIKLVNEIGPWSPFAGVLLLTAGISLMESVPGRLVPWVAAMLSLTLAVQIYGQSVVGSPWFGALAGSTVASLGAALIELYRPQLPRLVVFLPSFWLLVPGSLGVVSVTQLGLEPRLAGSTLLEAASVMCSIALGLIIGTTVARMVGIARRRRHELLRRRRHRRSR